MTTTLFFFKYNHPLSTNFLVTIVLAGCICGHARMTQVTYNSSHKKAARHVVHIKALKDFCISQGDQNLFQLKKIINVLASTFCFF